MQEKGKAGKAELELLVGVGPGESVMGGIVWTESKGVNPLELEASPSEKGQGTGRGRGGGRMTGRATGRGRAAVGAGRGRATVAGRSSSHGASMSQAKKVMADLGNLYGGLGL